ncbi:MAG: hypothetical protein HYZ33_03120, partial [Ignavibacteriales bacterium]|nr:hypothetical protein [Ignavibacteriales bacterium]
TDLSVSEDDSSRCITTFTLIILFLLFFCSFNATAQVEADSLESDTLETGDEIEALVEQTESEEESSLLDDLDALLFTNISVEVRSRLIQKLQRADGFTNGKYLGSPMKFYQRLKMYQGEHLSGGLLFEKDAGEEQFTNFTTGFIKLSSVGPFTSIIAGDYLVEAGQGISLWRGYDVRKGVNVVTPVKRKPRGIVPYASADENSFLRGIALQTVVSDFSLTGFYSRRELSGTIDTSNGLEHISSMYVTGYFRTESEMQKQNTFAENLFGGSITYKLSESNTIGLSGYRSSYSIPLSLSNGFSGDINSILSLNYNLTVRNLKLFGEWAKDNSNAVAGNSGLMIQPSHSIDIITSYRNYESGFFNPHGNGFAEGSDLSNEEGWYLGTKMKLHRMVTVSSYFDVFRFPEATFSSLYPSHGDDFMLQVESRPASKLLSTIRYARKRIEEDAGSFGDTRTKQSVRLNFDYKPSKNVKLRGRFEYVDVQKRLSATREHGTLVYGDIGMSVSKDLLLNFRLVFFKTDSFDAGVAEYENDLPGVLSVPILYGEGVRWYTFLKYEILTTLDISLKYSDLIREGVKHIGSGLDELPSNHDNRVGVQIDYRL